MSETKCKSCGKSFYHVSLWDAVESCWKCNDDELINLTHKENKMTELKPRNMTLPIDSKERKGYPLFRGCLRYFPAALAGVARISKLGNDKHNPGEDMHHARLKSSDHGDCIMRHLMDVQDLLEAKRQNNNTVTNQEILDEVSQMVWRALAYSQELHEELGAPKAPGAR